MKHSKPVTAARPAGKGQNPAHGAAAAPAHFGKVAKPKHEKRKAAQAAAAAASGVAPAAAASAPAKPSAPKFGGVQATPDMVVKAPKKKTGSKQQPKKAMAGKGKKKGAASHGKKH